ncbi:MAG: tetratricopeptide repeat protein, partial [Haliea sp.]
INQSTIPTLDVKSDRLLGLVNRSLAVANQEENAFVIVPMVAEFVQRRKPTTVAETGNRIQDLAFELVSEYGHNRYDRFPMLDDAWAMLDASLSRFLAGPNDPLQAVCEALFQYFNFSGRWDESLFLNREAESRAVAAGDIHNAGYRAYHAAWVHHLRGQADEMMRCAERASQHWRRAESGIPEQVKASRMHGIAHEMKNEFPAALEAYQEALRLCRTTEAESRDVANVLNDIAEAERLSGNYEAADTNYREAIRIARNVGEDSDAVTFAGNLAELALARENWNDAEVLARDALEFAENIGRQDLIASNCNRLAGALVRLGKKSEAQPLAQRAVQIYTDLGSPNVEVARQTLTDCEG